MGVKRGGENFLGTFFWGGGGYEFFCSLGGGVRKFFGRSV